MPAFVFAGQGSQRRGMGRDLFPLFPDHVRAVDRILGYSIEELCVDDDGSRLWQTQYAQPAIYVVNVLAYLRFQADTGITPSCLLGHSLGEYCALHLAGAFDFETGLELVAERGRLMAADGSGAMAAVIGLSVEDAHRVAGDWPGGGVWIANHNAPDEVVVSGHAEMITAAKRHFLDAGASTYVPLQVSGPFHTPLMRSAQTEFETVLSRTPLSAPRIPVISNLTARPYLDRGVRDTLAAQISNPVRWVDSITLLLGRGETRMIEIGPKRVLTPLIGKIAAAA
ncbi:MAG TPA: ACP S-malonyltransferase [Amycolatopsis sp.]|uniref:ACP S-malonyltransferase n=1 Tax=Amycolatopsis sp. TaxID=37632 RepID=UPI002B4899D0|nr:ACP S-malonyltransferase [Amycolatopsis sp.]HJQ45742.1 ACP S-malonyltransferase [Amycolatopsis sp.]HKS46064.1 ACP S-malonyltransferase [Amycolatopsis sp.]